MPWGVARSWSNNPSYSAGQALGNGWVESQAPVLQAPSNNNGNLSTLALVSNGQDARTFSLNNNGTVYTQDFFGQDQIVAAPASHTYQLATSGGAQVTFADFSTNWLPAQRGRMLSYAEPSGETLAVDFFDGQAGAAAGLPKDETWTAAGVAETYAYSYLAAGPNAGRLAGVQLSRSGTGVYRQVQYTYYDGTQGHANHGNLGDLELATVEDGASPPRALDTSYYRYYTAQDANPKGYQGGLKFAFGGASFDRLVANHPGATAATVDNLNDSDVAAYADNYFQYDASQRVSQVVAQGAGSSAEGGPTRPPTSWAITAGR
jgi:hypothetical protein